MEELKMLVEMLAETPKAVLWVAAGFMVYKLAVMGSIVGSLLAAFKLAVTKYHDYKTTPQTELVRKDSVIRSLVISAEFDYLVDQLERLKSVRSFSSSRYQESTRRHNYIHDSDIDWLREAIDAKLVEDQKNPKNEKHYRGVAE